MLNKDEITDEVRSARYGVRQELRRVRSILERCEAMLDMKDRRPVWNDLGEFQAAASMADAKIVRLATLMDLEDKA